MMVPNFHELLDQMIPNPVCELNYELDYQLLIATVLSAQSTDKRVNIVTKELFKYDLKELSEVDIEQIKKIIKSVGTYSRKSEYVKTIAKRLLNECDGVVPNDIDYLVTLPGVGRKTASVVVSNLFNEPAFAVDTHVIRTSNILGIVKNDKDPLSIEKKIKKKIKKDKWNITNSQLVLFGRYICKAKKSRCEECLFKGKCINTKKR